MWSSDGTVCGDFDAPIRLASRTSEHDNELQTVFGDTSKGESMNQYEFRRCAFDSREYRKLLNDGWELVCVSTLNTALVRRERS